MKGRASPDTCVVRCFWIEDCVSWGAEEEEEGEEEEEEGMRTFIAMREVVVSVMPNVRKDVAICPCRNGTLS